MSTTSAIFSKRNITYVVLFVGILLSSYVFWSLITLLLKRLIFESITISLAESVLAVFTFSLYAAILIIIAILETKPMVHLLIFGASVLPLLMLPYTLTTNLIFGAVIFVTLILLNGVIRHDIQLHIKPSLLHIASPKLAVLTLIFSIIISIQFYIAADLKLENTQFVIPPSYLDTVFELSEPFVRAQLEHQQDVLLTSYINRLDNEIPFLQKIPTEDKIALLNGNLTDKVLSLLRDQGLSESQINTFADDIKLDYLKTENNPTKPDEKPLDIIDSVFGEARKQLELVLSQFVETNKGVVPWILSSLLFITLSSVGLLTRFLSIFIAKGFLGLLSLIGLVQKIELYVKAERYVITGDNPTISPAVQATQGEVSSPPHNGL